MPMSNNVDQSGLEGHILDGSDEKSSVAAAAAAAAATANSVASTPSSDLSSSRRNTNSFSSNNSVNSFNTSSSRSSVATSAATSAGLSVGSSSPFSSMTSFPMAPNSNIIALQPQPQSQSQLQQQNFTAPGYPLSHIAHQSQNPPVSLSAYRYPMRTSSASSGPAPGVAMPKSYGTSYMNPDEFHEEPLQTPKDIAAASGASFAPIPHYATLNTSGMVTHDPNTNLNLAYQRNNSPAFFFISSGKTGSAASHVAAKRPRRKFHEIERIYSCNFPDCAKAYGTLNHLNAHITMQNHGSRRTPEEFKELRKQWKMKKKFVDPDPNSIINAGPSASSVSMSNAQRSPLDHVSRNYSSNTVYGYGSNPPPLYNYQSSQILPAQAQGQNTMHSVQRYSMPVYQATQAQQAMSGSLEYYIRAPGGSERLGTKYKGPPSSQSQSQSQNMDQLSVGSPSATYVVSAPSSAPTMALKPPPELPAGQTSPSYYLSYDYYKEH